MSPLDDLQARADALLTRTDDPATVEAKIASTEGPSRRFSAFIPSELDRALELAGELMRIAAAEGGEAGVAAALAEAERRADVEDVQLVRHAIELFIVHDPEAAQLAIPPIPPAAAKRAAAQLAGAIGREAALDWFREDPMANDHHRHWHIVYPARGRPGRGRAAPGPPGRAVLLHAPADARALRRRAAGARLRARRAVRRLPRADRRGLRGPPERHRRCGTSTAPTRAC